MDAPSLARLSVLMAGRERLHPYIRAFCAAVAAVPDGFGGLAPNRYLALEVPRSFWVVPAQAITQ